MSHNFLNYDHAVTKKQMFCFWYDLLCDGFTYFVPMCPVFGGTVMYTVIWANLSEPHTYGSRWTVIGRWFSSHVTESLHKNMGSVTITCTNVSKLCTLMLTRC